MYVVGLTGGIGSGKSTVADAFQQLGIAVVDADIVARQVVEPNEPALQRISEHFGAGILSKNGELDRSKLREQVFNNPSDKQWLEALLHPLIHDRINQDLSEAKSHYTILVVPLLLESDHYDWIDRILVVDLPTEVQLTRAAQRDGSDKSLIQSIIDSQMAREERLTKADDIINNEGSVSALTDEVNALHKKYLQLAASKAENHSTPISQPMSQLRTQTNHESKKAPHGKLS